MALFPPSSDRVPGQVLGRKGAQVTGEVMFRAREQRIGLKRHLPAGPRYEEAGTGDHSLG